MVKMIAGLRAAVVLVFLSCIALVPAVTGAEKQTDLALAFCADCKAEVDMFDRGIAQLRSSGEPATIRAKYNLKDWAEQ